MKKTVRIFVIIAMFFMATLMTGCSLDEYKEIDEKYTVRFVDEEGNFVDDDLIGQKVVFIVKDGAQTPELRSRVVMIKAI